MTMDENYLNELAADSERPTQNRFVFKKFRSGHWIDNDLSFSDEYPFDPQPPIDSKKRVQAMWGDDDSQLEKSSSDSEEVKRLESPIKSDASSQMERLPGSDEEPNSGSDLELIRNYQFRWINSNIEVKRDEEKVPE